MILAAMSIPGTLKRSNPTVQGSAVQIAASEAYMPGHAILPSGALVALAVGHNGVNHYQWISTDDGVSWGSATTVTSASNLDTAEIAPLANGNVIMSYATFSGGYDAGISVKIGTVTGSSISWGSPVTVTSGATNGGCASRVLQLTNGDLILPVFGPGGAGIVRSTDGGATWGGYVQVQAGSNYDVSEANVIQLDRISSNPGRLVLMIRNEYEGEGPGLGWSRSVSDDLGYTWSQPLLVLLGNPVSKPALTYLGGNKILLSARFQSPGAGQSTGFTTTYDTGRNWNTFTGIGDSGAYAWYSSSVLRPSGTISMLVSNGNSDNSNAYLKAYNLKQ